MTEPLKGRVAVITGANSGLGFGIACRLIDETPEEVPLTLVISTRTLLKATTTIGKLIERYKYRKPHYLTFDYILLDLSCMISVAQAARDLKQRFPHIDYFFANAATGDFKGVNWWLVFSQLLTHPIYSTTYGNQKIQGTGRLTKADHLGYVFQCNVFAQWYLINELVPILRDGGRIIWIGSLACAGETFDLDNDFQLLETSTSYEASKILVEMIHYASYAQFKPKYNITMVLSHPGISVTSMFADYLNPVTLMFMYLGFIMVRWLGSPWHTIDPYKGAKAPVWCALTDVRNLDGEIKYGSGATRFVGQPYVKTTPISDDLQSPKQAEKALEKIEALRIEWKTKLREQLNTPKITI